MSVSIFQILKQYWGYDNFREGQKEIIESVIFKNDTLALLPTGGGKSVCYQVPGLYLEGVCVVISPLIALMKDQVQQLKKRGIKAAAIISGMSEREIQIIIDNAHFKQLKFLYISPERLQSEMFQQQLVNLPVNLIAIDEAHCISQWGYDFRPSYLNIAFIKKYFHGVPFIALTATATKEVQQDICTQLQLHQPKIFLKSFHRDNLVYVVRKEDDKPNKLVEILNKVKGPGIVYVRNRRMTKNMAEWLSKNRISADFYHAGLSINERDKRQQNWLTNKTRVIVCTNAFGMGIDKPDVRVVVHIDLPESPEAYFQEAGRGGRDGKKSFVALLWNEDDVKQLEYSINNNFSSVDEVKRVYAALMNYLQIAVGSGNMQSFDFDLVDFTDKFNLQPTQVLKAFKVLEQHDYITLTDGAVLPARVMITLTRENLYRYEVEHKQSEPILKLLLRMHEGIKDQYCTVSEKRIAAELKMQVNDVIAQLKIMSKNEVLDYLPAKEKPQIILNTFCHKADDIELNVSNMNKLKAMQQQRIAAMVDYVTNNDVCRNVLLLNYFGENDAIPCGKCDICIEQKKKNYSAEKLMNIFNQLKENFSYHEFTLTEATNFISTASTNEISYMLEWLHSEHKIKYQNGKFKIQAWQ